MKSTNHFKETIQNHLEGRALNDELFATAFRKPNKSTEYHDQIIELVNKSRRLIKK